MPITQPDQPDQPDASHRMLHREHHVNTLTRILQAGFQHGGEHQFAEAICDAIEDRHPFEPDLFR